MRSTKSYRDAVDPLRQALEAFQHTTGCDRPVRWFWLACRNAQDLCDHEAWDALTTLQLQLAREADAVAVMLRALCDRAVVDLHRGDETMPG
jgi:hypothetical protein